MKLLIRAQPRKSDQLPLLHKKKMVKCTRGILELLAMRLKIDYGVTINFTETFNEQFNFCFGTS